MSRIDHVAVESSDPDATAAFYERVLGARIVKAEGHPVMAYLGPTGIAVHEPGRPSPHEWEEHDHGIAVGLFFRDPDGRQVEAITYRAADDPRRPPS